jgi:hypothetical protein
MDAGTKAQILALERLTTARLRQRYAEVFGEATCGPSGRRQGRPGDRPEDARAVRDRAGHGRPGADHYTAGFLVGLMTLAWEIPAYAPATDPPAKARSISRSCGRAVLSWLLGGPLRRALRGRPGAGHRILSRLPRRQRAARRHPRLIEVVAPASARPGQGRDREEALP